MLIAFTLLFNVLSSYLKNMATFGLKKNYIFDNFNCVKAHITQLAERFHGKDEGFSSILNAGNSKTKCFV